MAKKFENSKYDKEAVETFWMLLAVHGSSLTKRQVQERLRKWNDVSNNSLEGIGFSSYAKKMLEAISLRYGDV
jgi:site-specific recombinase XerC